MAFQFKMAAPAAKYKAPAAYFSMEFALDQSLKIYSGGLGFLAGSHMRSAYELKQNLIGIGMLWTYGYYDQVRNPDQTMKAEFLHKQYSFLEDTGLVYSRLPFTTAEVHVKALYLAPDTFGTAPMFFLTTDIEENDYLSRTISHHLYDPDAATPRGPEHRAGGRRRPAARPAGVARPTSTTSTRATACRWRFSSTKSSAATWPKCGSAWYSPLTPPSWPATRSAP